MGGDRGVEDNPGECGRVSNGPTPLALGEADRDPPAELRGPIVLEDEGQVAEPLRKLTVCVYTFVSRRWRSSNASRSLSAYS